MNKNEQMTEQQQQDWVREQYQTATKYLADKGLVTTSVADTESRYLVPSVAVWKLNLIDQTSVWVISGDLPTDHISIEGAKDARDAVRHFSMKWQLQAENLLKSEEKEHQEFAQLLISRANGLYNMHEEDSVWKMS